MGDKWIDFPLPDGSYSDDTRPWTDQDIVNYLPVRAEASGTRSKVKYRTAPGLPVFIRLGSGPIRGMHDVEGLLYVVSGNKLYSLTPDGQSAELGDIHGVGRVRMAHNQVAGGNQVVIATNSSAYVYTDEGAVNAGSGGGDGGGETPAYLTPIWTEASTSLGTHGGYADDAEYTYPLPSVFGSNIFANGDFSSATDINDWKNSDGSALSAAWTIDAGTLKFTGGGAAKAYGLELQLSLPYMPLPRYTVTCTADVEGDAGVQTRIGIARGTSGVGDIPVYADASTAAEYTTETNVSHDWTNVVARTSMLGGSCHQIVTFTPYIEHVCASAGLTSRVDNFTVEINAVPADATAETPAHIDFDSGLTGWTLYPDPSSTNPYAPTMEVDSGELSMTVTSEYFGYRWVICDDPLTGADEIGKYIGGTMEVWCNDPKTVTTAQGTFTSGGAVLGIATKIPTYDYVVFTPGLPLRGDWTEREMWVRQVLDDSNAAGVTHHIAVYMRASVGKTVKVRNIVPKVTDEVID